MILLQGHRDLWFSRFVHQLPILGIQIEYQGQPPSSAEISILRVHLMYLIVVALHAKLNLL